MALASKKSKAFRGIHAAADIISLDADLWNVPVLGHKWKVANPLEPEVLQSTIRRFVVPRLVPLASNITTTFKVCGKVLRASAPIQ